MKKIVIALFPTRTDAENTVAQLHSELSLPTDEISYIYRNTEGNITEVDPDEVTSNTPGEGAKKGAVVGGSVGAVAGIATVAGVIPVIGPIFAAGPIISALGLGIGALGTTAAGAATGAVAGGVIGALTAWGTSEVVAKNYEDRVLTGDVLIAAHTDNAIEATAIFEANNAFDINVLEPNI